MNYINEQIIKTFEHLLNLRCKYGLIDLSSRKSRPIYRINQEKLDKYHSQYNSNYTNKHLEFDENKKIPMIKIIHRKTISTQTTFNKTTDPSIDLTSSVIPKVTNDHDNEDDTESSNTFPSSLSDINEPKKNTNSTSLSSLSSSSNNSISSNKFNNNLPKRVYIRSIIQHMLSDATSND